MKFPPTLLLLVLFIVASCQLNAQLFVGLSGGGGISSEVLFRAAIPAEVSLNKTISIRTELVYIQRENRDVLQKLNGDRSYWQPVISYLELPILAKAHLDFKSISVYALAGPKFGYGIKLAANYLEDNTFYEEHFSFSDKGIHQWDIGLNLGFGLEKRINKNRKIFVDYRYYLGLYDLDKDASTSIFNQGQVINLGFLLPVTSQE